MILDVLDNIYNGQDECSGDVSLNGFNVSQLASKLERLALVTPQTTRIRPPDSVEEDFDFKEHPDSIDSDSGRPVTSNDSSIYRSFITDSVENQQLDSLDFSSTICNNEVNESNDNIKSVHENLASVNLDLVGSDFEDSSHNLTAHSFPNKSLSEETIFNKSSYSTPELNNSKLKQHISLMDDVIGSETKFQV